MNNLPTLLGPIKERLEAATPGPWTVSARRIYGGNLPDGIAHVMDANCDKWNTQLIAHAPTDLARLIAAVEIMGEALEKIYSNKDLCVYGSPAETGDPRQDFQLGSNIAYGESASVAHDALTEARAALRGEK